MKGYEESKMTTSLDKMTSNTIVENEIEILQSHTILADVVKELHLYTPIFQKEGLQTFSAYTSSPIVVEVATPEHFKEFPHPDSVRKYKKVHFTYDEKSRSILLENKHIYQTGKWNETPYGKIRFIKNKNYSKPPKPINDFYFSKLTVDLAISNLSNQLSIETSGKGSSFVNLFYKDENPQRALNILNQLILSYQKAENTEKDKLAENTLLFVTNRLDMVVNELDSIEERIQKYKSGKGAIDLGKQGELYLENVSANDQRLSEITTQLSILGQIETSIKNNETSNDLAPSVLGINDPVLTQLIDKLQTSELQYEKLKKTVGENNPNLTAIKDQSNLLKTNLLQNIKGQKQSLNAAKENIKLTNATYNSILQFVPQKERQLLDISREQQIKRELYSFLLQKKEESELAYSALNSKNRVVDMANIHPTPVNIKKSFIILIGIIVSLGVFILFITIRDFILNRIQYRSDIASLTEIPIIGEIDFDRSKQPIVIEGPGKSIVAEQFRKLRISLNFLPLNNLGKNIMVTSSIAGEGKSFVSANLAASIAVSGKKVVLLDMDLQKPMLSKLFKLQDHRGVVDILNNRASITEATQNIENYQNLSFIAAGDVSEYCAEIWNIKRLKEFVKELNQNFDVIIIDTAPLLLINDGYILSELCDVTLYIIRQNVTPKAFVKKLQEEIHINPIKNPVFVYNGIKTRGVLTNYGKYGKEYGYTNSKRSPIKWPIKVVRDI